MKRFVGQGPGYMTVAALVAALAACAGGRFGGLRVDRLADERALFESGEYDKVAERLHAERIQRLPARKQAEAYHLLGRSEELGGRLNRALQVYQLAEGLFPRDLNILSDLANLLSAVGLDERARPYYERVLKNHPNNAGGNHGIARIFRKQGLLFKSQRHYERTIAEKGWSENPAIWREYAEVLAERQLFAEAVKAVHRSLSLRYDADSVVSLAKFQRGRGDRESAYNRIDEAVRKSPDRPEIRLQKSLWLLEDRREGEALLLSEEVLRGDPGAVLARWIRGSILLRRGEFGAARADFAAGAKAGRAHPFIAKVCAGMLAQLDHGLD